MSKRNTRWSATKWRYLSFSILVFFVVRISFFSSIARQSMTEGMAVSVWGMLHLLLSVVYVQDVSSVLFSIWIGKDQVWCIRIMINFASGHKIRCCESGSWLHVQLSVSFVFFFHDFLLWNGVWRQIAKRVVKASRRVWRLIAMKSVSTDCQIKWKSFEADCKELFRYICQGKWKGVEPDDREGVKAILCPSWCMFLC